MPISDSRSFFSVQLSVDTVVSDGLVVPFDVIIVNYGNDYIQSGGIYMYVLLCTRVQGSLYRPNMRQWLVNWYSLINHD